METCLKQDLPPAGGYEKIIYKRIPQKPYWNGAKFLSIYGILSLFSVYLMSLEFKARRKVQIEMYDVNISLEPLLLAERDRALLKQLRLNREEEARLMKDVPNWEVGTLYGEHLYKTVPPNYFLNPFRDEYYGHTKKKYNEADSWAHHLT